MKQIIKDIYYLVGYGHNISKFKIYTYADCQEPVLALITYDCPFNETIQGFLISKGISNGV